MAGPRTLDSESATGDAAPRPTAPGACARLLAIHAAPSADACAEALLAALADVGMASGGVRCDAAVCAAVVLAPSGAPLPMPALHAAASWFAAAGTRLDELLQA